MSQMLAFDITAGLFFFWVVSILWHMRWVQPLPAFAPPPALQRQIRCSIVMAARNEEARIEQAVRRLLLQQGVQLEIIVVDDRSTDRTNDILARLAKDEPRLQVRRVDTLPDGWLGKCHACHIGACGVTSEWVLFTDADCWLKPDVLARALHVAECEGVDHITITSGLASHSVGLKASHLMFLMSLANWFSGVNRDRRKSYMGIGAFNLVRAAAYRECGGYEALRLSVVDDMKLGLLLRRAGKRTRAFIGGADVECYWGDSAWSAVKIMEKNYFAAVDYRLGLVLAGSAFTMAVSAMLIAGALSGTTAGTIAALSPLALILPGSILARRLSWPPSSALPVPFMFPLFLYAVLNSTFVTLRQGGIRWRDTFYPLETLRAGNVR